ncbi:MAG: PLP-dependent aminotransferase family protein, partial [Terriglobales bacterium]
LRLAAKTMSFHPQSDAQAQPAKAAPPVKLSRYAERLCQFVSETLPPEMVPELNFGAPRLDELPLERWQQLMARAGRLLREDALTYTSDPFGYLPLREAIANYLRRARAANCTAEQIVIFAEPEAGTDLICRLFLEPGDTVAVEHPGFPGARRMLETQGIAMNPIQVDGQGLIVQQLYNCETPLKMAYVTPSHHDPTGVVLSLPRRFELLRWARANGAVIIEDDYDSEYRYGEEQAQSLQGLDTDGLVFYRYNFWRVLYPLVKIGFLVIPRRFISVFQRAKQLLGRDMSLLEQHALADLLTDGHFERHIRRMRGTYARRRAALIQSLTIQFGRQVSISSVSAGMHVLVRFQTTDNDALIARCAHEAGFPLTSTSVNYTRDPVRGEFLIGFAHLTEDDLREATARFAAALAQARAETAAKSVQPLHWQLPQTTGIDVSR